jgi:integrase
MKGSVYPRPCDIVRDAKTGKTRRVPRKGSTWYYGFPLMRNGKRCYISKGGFRVKTDAEAALADALAEYGRGVVPVERSRKVTLRAYFIDEHLPRVQRARKATTSKSYHDLMALHVLPHLGDAKLTDLTPGSIERAYAIERESGRKTKNGGKLSEATMRRIHVVLKATLSAAVRDGLLLRNPADSINTPVAAHREMRTLSPEQARAFVTACLAGVADPRTAARWRYWALFILALNTGLRRGELCGLLWDDIDLDRGAVMVRRSRTTVGYEVRESTPKSGRARNVALDPETVAVLRRWRKQQLEERLQWGDAWSDTGFVFTREDGTPVHPMSVSQSFEWAAKRAGIPAIRFHDLRHTSATLALVAGIHPKVVQERLGHANISITLDTYSHVTPNMQQDAAAKVGALVFGR